MGTDIHPIVQVRRAAGEPWTRVEIPRDGDYGNFLDRRNYNLFAVLGNVRNGTGFAGIRTSAGFPFISDCRGLPDDLGMYLEEDGTLATCPKHRTQQAIEPVIEIPTVEVLPDDHDPATCLDCTSPATDSDLALVEDEDDEEERWSCSECHWFGDHSWSWVTLAELLAYDWKGGQTALIGVMPLAKTDDAYSFGTPYLDWRKTEEFAERRMPPSYSGGVSGRNVVTIDEPKVQAAIDEGLDPTKHYYVRLARKVGVSHAVGEHFVEAVIPWLQTLGEPDNVRIVFGFDS